MVRFLTTYSVRPAEPAIDLIRWESRLPQGPFGIKEVGELAVPRIAPAIAVPLRCDYVSDKLADRND
jgi:hypothetical protein